MDVKIHTNYPFVMHIKGFQKSPGDTKIDVRDPFLRHKLGEKMEISFSRGSMCFWRPQNFKS